MMLFNFKMDVYQNPGFCVRLVLLFISLCGMGNNNWFSVKVLPQTVVWPSCTWSNVSSYV